MCIVVYVIAGAAAAGFDGDSALSATTDGARRWCCMTMMMIMVIMAMTAMTTTTMTMTTMVMVWAGARAGGSAAWLAGGT